MKLKHNQIWYCLTDKKIYLCSSIFGTKKRFLLTDGHGVFLVRACDIDFSKIVLIGEL